MSETETRTERTQPTPTPLQEVSNPPYVVPYGHADAPPPVPREVVNPDPQVQSYLDGFVKSPDPRDPPTSELTPGELTPPTTNEGTGGEAPATAPPVNVDVPHASQDGLTLNCTMGNWEGTPTAYAYQWKRDGVDVEGGDGGATLPVTEADVGVDYLCVVTAGNAIGATEAPASNMVTVVADAAREADPEHKSGHRSRRSKAEDPF